MKMFRNNLQLFVIAFSVIINFSVPASLHCMNEAAKTEQNNQTTTQANHQADDGQMACIRCCCPTAWMFYCTIGVMTGLIIQEGPNHYQKHNANLPTNAPTQMNTSMTSPYDSLEHTMLRGLGNPSELVKKIN